MEDDVNWQEILKKRQYSYSINKWDDTDLAYSENWLYIVPTVIDFFTYSSSLIYPAKSFFVAIVYAKCLEKYFGGHYLQYLDKRDLLPDDKFFSTYSEAKQLYDSILMELPDNIFDLASTQKTINYFKKEFLIEE